MKIQGAEHPRRFLPRMSSIAIGVAVVVLAIAGLGRRLLAERVDALLDEYLQPKQPLASLPLQIGSWTGRDIPMDEQIRRIAGDDDFVNREYQNVTDKRVASIYVGYIGRPRSRLGHRPDVCYPAHGYRQVSCQATEIPMPGSQPVPALLYEYAPPGLGGWPQLVIATYAINGQWMNDSGSANDYNVRSPNLFSHQDAYVARVQISLASLGDRAADLSVLSAFAAQLVTRVQDLLPR